jgi:hypothetical protein
VEQKKVLAVPCAIEELRQTITAKLEEAQVPVIEIASPVSVTWHAD